MKARNDKKLEALVEQKILEFLGDPDNGLTLKPTFVSTLRRNMRKKGRKLIPHSAVLRRYGLR